VRLAKYLAHAGIASRRAAEEIVRSGRVAVAGETVTDPARDSTSSPGGRRRADAHGEEDRLVLMLNKPPASVDGKDTQGRRTVLDLVNVRGARPVPGRPAGRHTYWAILLTNDGALANELTHPRFESPRPNSRPGLRRDGGGAALRALREGSRASTTAARGPGDGSPDGSGRARGDVHEGRKRQVRR
jgi:23S rRNA pseudouridine2605 synthase